MFRLIAPMVLAILSLGSLVRGQDVSLQSLVTPSTIISKDGHVVTFAIHGFIEFKSLAELFPYIKSQTERWKPEQMNESQRGELQGQLLRREYQWWEF